MGENHFAPVPTAIYGLVLLIAAISYTLLQRSIITGHTDNAKLATAVGKDVKGKLSIVFYVIAIAAAFLHQGIAVGLYVLVALMWLAPDPRIESRFYG
jgi:uncharacterized membrane protein